MFGLSCGRIHENEEDMKEDELKMPGSNEDLEFIGPGSSLDSKDPEDLQERHSRFTALRHEAGRCFRDNHYRKLAICSIVCGLSCIGAVALKYSVKAKETKRTDPERAAVLTQKARKFSIISIATLFSILAAIPILMALVSYLATLKD